jgi:hypothetical protein
MTNTQRPTTVRTASADKFEQAGNSKTPIRIQSSKPYFSSASDQSRQGTVNGASGPQSSIQHEVQPAPQPQADLEIIHSRPSIVLVDSDAAHALSLADRLRSRPLALTVFRDANDALRTLHGSFPEWDIVIVNVSDAVQPWVAILRRSRGLLQPQFETYTSVPLYIKNQAGSSISTFAGAQRSAFRP